MFRTDASNLSSRILAGFLIVLGLRASAPAADATASSCSLADIQAAVDFVKLAGGGTVFVPEGTGSHGGDLLKMPDGVSLAGAGQSKTFIENANISYMPKSYGKLDSGFRITGFNLKGNSALQFRGCHDFRVDSITIICTSGTAISIQESHSGVVDHCRVNMEKNLYGIAVSQGYTETFEKDWVPDIKEIVGSDSAIYIEDCFFNGNGHATIGHGNAHYVVRHCEFNAGVSHQVDAHGPGYGPPCGTRLMEIYDNVFNGKDAPYKWKAIGVRGGAAIIFNNTFNDYDNSVGLHLESRAQQHPAEMRVRQTYIWNNTHNNLGSGYESKCPGAWVLGSPHCNEVFVWDIGTHEGLVSKNEIHEDKEYFLRAPTKALDGFTYTPYAYPHPLVSGLAAISVTPQALQGPGRTACQPAMVKGVKHVAFTIPASFAGGYDLEVFDVSGRKIWSQIQAAAGNGASSAKWEFGRKASGGVLYAVLKHGNDVFKWNLVLMPQ